VYSLAFYFASRVPTTSLGFMGLFGFALLGLRGHADPQGALSSPKTPPREFRCLSVLSVRGLCVIWNKGW